jgi:hypothetical protein
MQEAQAVTPIVVLVVSIIVLLVCREVTCWYFKINDLSRKIDTTNKTLADIRDLLAHTAAASAAPTVKVVATDDNFVGVNPPTRIVGISPKWPIKK